jgi:hypothetical protein
MVQTADRLRQAPAAAALGDVPAELRARSQWVCWRNDPKRGKVPINPHTGSLAKVNDLKTWGTFEQSLDRCRRDDLAGVGYVFSADDPYCGADLDGCRGADGTFADWANETIEQLVTYWEISPSGAGLKAICRASLPTGARHEVKMPGEPIRKKDPAIEVYDRRRFFATTGERLVHSPRTCEPGQAELNKILERLGFMAKAEKRKNRSPMTGRAEGDDEARARDALRFVHGFDDYGVWVMVGMALHASDLPGAFKLWCEWSGQSSKYTHEACELKWRSFKRDGGLKLGTLFHLATQGGWRPPTARAGGNNTPPPSAPTAGTEGAGPKIAAQIILDDLLLLRPVFKDRSAIHCADGQIVTMADYCCGAPLRLIKQLAGAEDAPIYKGHVDRDKLPALFKRWAPTAYKDALEMLPDEDAAKLGDDAPAREAFRSLVRDAMLVQVALGDIIGSQGATQTERRSLIEWCVKFAKDGPWKSIRSYKCWTKCRQKDDGELILYVAVRQELFAQLHADKKLRDLTPTAFSKRCQRYGVGNSSRKDRPAGGAAVVLDPDFVVELTGGIPDDDEAGKEGDTHART